MKYERTTNINGTSLKGYIEIPYLELVSKLPATIPSDEYKTDVNWGLEFEDGTIATIYNWKNGKNYLGEKGLDIENITKWNIGCNSAKAVEYINNIINKGEK